MASDVLSLFGIDPNVLQQQKNDNAIAQASRMSADYAIGAAGGGMLGAGINSALGLQTPDMAQAASVQQGMAGTDLSSVAGLRDAASKMMMGGNYAQGMALHNQARELEAQELAAAQTAEDRGVGKVEQVVVTPKDPNNPLSQDVKHTVVRYRDGRITDVSMGSTFENEAQWIEALKGNGAEAQEDTVITLDPKSGLVAAAEIGEANAATRAITELESDIRVTKQNIEHVGYGWQQEAYTITLAKQEEELAKLKAEQSQSNKGK